MSAMAGVWDGSGWDLTSTLAKVHLMGANSLFKLDIFADNMIGVCSHSLLLFCLSCYETFGVK